MNSLRSVAMIKVVYAQEPDENLWLTAAEKAVREIPTIRDEWNGYEKTERDRKLVVVERHEGGVCPLLIR